MLKKRNLVTTVTVKSLKITPGPRFDIFGQKAQADLTHEMVVKGTWKDAVFKPVNIDAGGVLPAGGALHPLMKVRSMFRETFIAMGFEEMETNKFVESSFWNFDALFQPQQHPARDAHDTFFVKMPASTLDLPADYLARVKATFTGDSDPSLMISSSNQRTTRIPSLRWSFTRTILGWASGSRWAILASSGRRCLGQWVSTRT